MRNLFRRKLRATCKACGGFLSGFEEEVGAGMHEQCFLESLEKDVVIDCPVCGESHTVKGLYGHVCSKCGCPLC